jgi:uncharacterized protein with PIN domain
MLKRLGQWLRIAGHDVLMLPDGTDDRELIRRAAMERRRLLTRDRSIAAQTGAAADLVLLDCDGLEDCVGALNRQLDIDWLMAPFSRCMNCNTLLVPASDRQRRQIPAEALRSATRVLYCPSCDQLYWDGSHVRRMRERLARWNGRTAAEGGR